VPATATLQSASDVKAGRYREAVMTPQDTVSDIGSLPVLLPSRRRPLRAANKAPRTIETHMLAADQLMAYLQDHGMPRRADLVHCEPVEAASRSAYRGSLPNWGHEVQNPAAVGGTSPGGGRLR